jgi:hypothetical protein
MYLLFRKKNKNRFQLKPTFPVVVRVFTKHELSVDKIEYNLCFVKTRTTAEPRQLKPRIKKGW